MFGFCENISSISLIFTVMLLTHMHLYLLLAQLQLQLPQTHSIFFCFLGWVVAWVFYSLEPFIAGHPCTEAWLSFKTHISFTCSYFWIFPTFFLLCSCLYLIPRLLSWVPVSCAVPLLSVSFSSPNNISQASLWISVKWNYKIGYTLTQCECYCLVNVA